MKSKPIQPFASSSKRWVNLICTGILTVGLAAGCAGTGEKPGSNGENNGENAGAGKPYKLSIALRQVGDIPAKGNEVEQAIGKYTNTELAIQWIPQAAFDDKINVMIASNELPQILKVNYVPNVMNAARNGLFWELGPYLKDYPNLTAQDQRYYDNIKIDGKLYGIPNYRDIGRAAVVYRKDWFDQAGLTLPVTMDDWYNVMKAFSEKDPDGNGKADSYGTMLFKNYNAGTQPVITRLAVSIGGVNRWGEDNGKFTPEFKTQPYMDVLQLFRKLYADKLINQDFAVYDVTELDKAMYDGRVGMRLNVSAQNVQSYSVAMKDTIPTAEWDIAPFAGPDGPRIAGEPGNFGFLAIPKSAVKDEAELKRVLTFLDKLMDEPMSTLQMRGIEGKHYELVGGTKTKFTDFSLFQREVKPYRDGLLNIEGYNVPEIEDTPIALKGTKMARENVQYAVPNPALTLNSPTYNERGVELDLIIRDAETKYIMGQIDDAGFQAEVDKWAKAGGDAVVKEYESSFVELGG